MEKSERAGKERRHKMRENCQKKVGREGRENGKNHLRRTYDRRVTQRVTEDGREEKEWREDSD